VRSGQLAAYQLAKRVNVMANIPKPKRKITIELPPWALERLESAARVRRIKQPGNIAALLIVARLAKGSLDQDLRGLMSGMGGPYSLHDPEFVKEMIS
jgi:hypothetical protein